MIAWAGAGLLATDAAEKKLGFEATDADREKLKESVPKITFIDRERGH